jgi:hypothetical protein
MRRFVPGLFLFLALAGSVPAQVTYSKEISRIFQARCQQCHREGDVAPFALKDYETAVTWGRDIQNQVRNGNMPPWKPVPGYGEFRDSRALTPDEKQMILDWIDAGMPEGDPADLPAPIISNMEWLLGPPDKVLQMAQGYTPPIGGDVYRCFVIPSGFTENTDLSAVDILPGNRQIVHHVIVYQDTTGQAQKLDGADGQPGYTCFGGPGVDLSFGDSVLAGWAPGQRPSFLPDGIGIQVQKGSTLIMQVHYSPSATTGEDITRLGFYKAATKVQQHLFAIPVLNDKFTIPAGAANFTVSASLTVPLLFDAKAIYVYPHMHLLGRQIQMNLIAADKTSKPMIYEDNWDFRWQGYYYYQDAVALKAGSSVEVTCTFDNSDNNPNNPNTTLRDVSWGERTIDEMCVGFLGVTFDNERFLPLNFQKKMVSRPGPVLVNPRDGNR